MAQYVPAGFRGLRVLHEHNAEYVIWQRQSEIETGPRRWVAWLEAMRLRRYEASALAGSTWCSPFRRTTAAMLLELGTDPERVRSPP